MKRLLSFLTLALLICAGAWAEATASQQAAAALEVINDFMGTNSGLTVNVTINPSMRDNGKDKFTYTLSGTTLSITASNGVAACRGFYDFVKSNGAGICSWSANRFKAPNSYTTTTKTVTSPYRDHQYLNVVTYGYSMPYWNADRWDKEINWMALHGIDMPLMLVGSETIYRDVFNQLYNTTSSQLDEWEVGPATLPWMRMGNLAGNSFDGPLGEHWHTTQKALAKHILERMGKLGMKPVVPAFGGFVPPAVAQQLGGATQTGWGWVPNEYKNYRLTPTAGTGGQDGDFKKIGKKFIELWDAEYESSYGSEFKYYLSDSFNEMTVPNDASVLQTYGEQIYGAIKEGSGNNDAVWVTQGWEFVYGSGKWTNGSTSDAKYKALTASVPQGKFMSLYMSPEYGNGKWSSYDNFDGDDWVYTMLPNMGGKNFWTGNLNNYAQSWPKSMAQSGAKNNCTGWGMTMEGIEYNELLYELIADMGWTDPATGKVLNDWIAEYGNARYGTAYTTGMQNLINTLRNTVYTSYIDHANFGWQGNNKSSGYYNAGNINTVNDTFFEGFETFFNDDNIGELRTIAENSGLDETLRADLIEYAAFYAAARVEKICKRITTANNTGNKTLANELIGKLDKVMTDMDYILTGHPIYDEAKWEQKARTLANGNTDAEKKYVKNARRIVTTWYGNHQSHEAVNDYASRIYAGIIRDYYLPRLKAELNQLVNGTPCNLRDIERTFTPNGNVSTDAPALSAPGYYLGNDEKTTVADGMTTTNTSDAVLLANIQALVEEAQEAGEIIIEKNNLTVSTDAETHWYFVNSNNPSYTDRSLTETSVDGVKSTVKAQTTEASNEQIWRFVDNHDGTVRMENRNGQTLTWENGTAKTYIANINASMTYEKDEANTRYVLMPEGIGSNKAIHLNNGNGVPEAYGYKDAGTTNYYAGSTWTLSNANSYIGVPSDEDFARITRRFQGFQTSVWGTGSYGSVGQPKSAAALQAAIDAVATRDLALDTYTDYLATYDTALKANFTLPTDAEALKLFDLIISAFQIDPNVNCNTEDQATFKAALQTAQTALADGATGNTASAAATTLEAAVKTFITNTASFPYVSKAPANGKFDESSKVITLKVKNAGYITTAAVDEQAAFTLGNSTAPTTNAGYWVVSGNDTQGYTFYNVGAGATKVLGMTGSEDNARAKLYDVNSTNGVTTKFLYKKNTNGDAVFYISGNNAWNNRTSNGKTYLALWNDSRVFGTANGSAIVIATVENVELNPGEEPEPSERNPATNIRTTFTNSGASWDNVTFNVNATDAEGNTLSDVAVAGSGTVYPKALNVGSDKLGINYQTSGSGSATVNFTVSNLPAGSSFSTISLPMYAVNAGGNYQSNAAGTSEINVTVTVKEGDTVLYTETMQNFNITAQKNGNLNSELVFNAATPITIEGTSATVSFTISKGTTNNGCYMAFQSLNLTTEVIVKPCEELQEKINSIFDFFNGVIGQIGYPSYDAETAENLAVYAEIYEGEVTEANYEQALAAYNALLNETNIILPEDGKAYLLKAVHVNADGTIKNSYNIYSTPEGQITGKSSAVGDEGYARFIARRVGEGNQIVLVNELGRYLCWFDATNDTKSFTTKGATEAYDATYSPIVLEHATTEANNNESGVKALTAMQRFGLFQMKGHPKNANTQYQYFVYDDGNNHYFVSGNPGYKYYNAEGRHTFLFQIVEDPSYTYNKPTLVNADNGYYATIYLPFPMQVPAGVECYRGTTDNGSNLSLELMNEENAPVPAGAYVLYSSQNFVDEDVDSETYGQALERTQQLVIPATAAPTAPESNLFTGSTKNGDAGTMWSEELSGNNPYVLANKSKGIGFYRYTAETYPKGKAIYLAGNSSSECIGLNMDDIISAIEALHGNTGDNEIFDLQGRRLDKAEKGQVNVINGKKVMFK